MTLAPRVVVVHRRTELEELIDRHGTRGQAAFFMGTRGRDLAEVETRYRANQAALGWGQTLTIGPAKRALHLVVR